MLQASSWVEQEQLDERLMEMEAHKAQLAADLQATHVCFVGGGAATLDTPRDSVQTNDFKNVLNLQCIVSNLPCNMRIPCC